MILKALYIYISVFKFNCWTLKKFYLFVILGCEGSFSCVDGFCMDGFSAEELNEFKEKYEENFFTRGQICDGNIACPATEFDEMGCNPANRDTDDEDTSNPGPNPEPLPNA